MTKEYSPFTPGVPVPIDFFIGRNKEINRILSAIKKSTAMGTVERLFIQGERGIGKSSVCKFVRALAEKELEVIGLHVFLGGTDTLEEMARRVFERLLRENSDKPWYQQIKQFLGNHVRQLDIFGMTVEFSASQQDLQRVVNDFLPALTNLFKQIPHKKGMVLILDDLNGLAAVPRFANWLKSLVDEMAVSMEKLPLTLILVGLPEKRRQLISMQPSLDRIFDPIILEKFDEQETKEFYLRALKKVNVAIDDPALNLLYRFSGGYPVLMHELGDAVFKSDEDNKIEADDTMNGVVTAAQIIGAKYIEPNITDAIRSQRYHVILKKLAHTPLGDQFKRSAIVSKLSIEEIKVFDNFLRRMQQLGLIKKNPEKGAGSYTFANELYYLYFYLQTFISNKQK